MNGALATPIGHDWGARSGRLCRLFGTLVLGVALAGLGRATSAEETASGPSTAALEFRRYLVPESEIERHVREGYVPIRRERFAEMLAEINAGATASSRLAEARVTRADYSARLDGDQLIDGQARLELTRSNDQTSALILAPCGLAVGRPQWEGDAASSANLGSDPAGNTVVLVDRTSPLLFAWSLKGRLDERGQAVFDLRLPAAPLSQMRLDLPSELSAVVDVGVASPIDAPLPEDRRAESGPPPEKKSTRTWLLELGGHSRAELRIVPRETPLAERRLVLLRQTSRYSFTEAGLECVARLSLDIYNEPLRELTIELDPGLQLLTARTGETNLVARRLVGTGVGERLVLDLPNLEMGAGREVVVTAFAPLVVDRAWRLPGVRVANAAWQQGTATLELPQTMVLKRLVTQACVETAVEPLPPPAAGELRRLQLYRPDAFIDVSVGFQPPLLTATAGTTLRISQAMIAGQLAADIVASQGTVFALDARVHDGWLIDRVETVPAEALEAGSAWSLTGRQLRVRLRQAVGPDRPLRLLVSARRRVPTLPMSGKELRILDLDDVRVSRSLVALSPEAPYRLEVSRDAGLQRLDLAALTTSEQTLLAAPERSLVYVDDPAANALAVALSWEDPRYAATIAIEAAVESQQLKETCRIRCAPQASRVARLRVQCSQPNPNTTWRLVGDEDGGLSVRREAEAEAAGGGATWQLTLLRPRTEPFEIEAVSTSAFVTSASVSVVSLPEASSQEATLEVRSNDGTYLLLDVENLRPIPAEEAAASAVPRTRAVYSYDPSRDAVARISRATDVGSQSPAWIWSLRLVSRVGLGGDATHAAVLDIENTGLSQFTVAFPADASQRRVTVNGEESTAAGPGGTPVRCLIRLPSGDRFPTVVLRYTTPGPARGLSWRLAATWPSIELPILDRTWSVWLPPAYTAVPDASNGDDPAGRSSRWDDRLCGFRPFRLQRGPFNLFSADDWRRLAGPSVLSPAEARAEHCLRRLEQARQELPNSGDAAPTWGELLAAYRPRSPGASEGSPPPLWIDARALHSVGITPRTALLPGDRSEHDAAELLTASDLALVADSDEVCLTSLDAVSGWDVSNSRAGSRNVATVPTGKSLRALGGDNSPLGLPAAGWAAAPPMPTYPWTRIRETEAVDLPVAGWHNVRLQVGRDESPSLTLYQPRFVRLLGAVLLLATLAVSSSMLRRRRAALAALTVACAVVLLLVPSGWVPAMRGLFWGSAIALSWSIVPRLPRRSKTSPASESAISIASRLRRPSSATSASLLVWVLVSASSDVGRGAEPVAAPGPPAQPYPVLFPVAEDGQPTGSYVYVPRPFYEAMYLRAAATTASPRTWLIQSASYEVILNRDEETGEPTEVSVVEVGAEFDVQVFEPGTRIRLPIGLDGVRLVDAMVDGQTAQPVWQDSGRSLSFDVETPRALRVALSLRPLVQTSAGGQEFTVKIPPLARARARVKTTLPLEGIEIPTARGSVTRDATRREITAELGPTDTLSVRWPGAESRPRESPEVEVAELLLLRVQPNSVVLDGQFTFQIRAGRQDFVELLADPRLRLLPLAPNPWVVRPSIQDGTRQRIRFELNRPVSGEVKIAASFLLSGTAGLGTLTAPQVEAVGNRLAAPWVGVWAAPGLDVVLPPTLSPSAAPVTDFLALWGSSEFPPQQVFRLPREEPPPALTVQPVHPRTEARQTLDLSVGLDETSVEFRADLTMRDGTFLQQRVAIPADYRVLDAQVTRDGVNRVLRWADDGAGTLTVFFTSPLTGEHVLVLRGEMPGPLALPAISVLDASVSDQRVRIYRRPSVQVAVEQLSGLETLADSRLGQYDPARGRLVAVLSARQGVAPDAFGAVLKITPNRPAVRGRLVTQLLFAEESWFVAGELQLSISRGEVDLLRVELPRAVALPVEVDPPLSVEVQEGPDPARHTLVLKPEQSIRGAANFRLRSRLQTVRNEPIRAPDIRLLDANELRRFLVLPTRIGSQPIAWETSGLQSTVLREGPAGSAEERSYKTAFQVVGATPEAIIRDLDRGTGAPQVHLADLYLNWCGDRSLCGVAAFDLEPARLSEVQVEIPPSLRLVQALVAGLPATAAPKGGNRWGLAVGPEQWPQRIELIFTGRLPLDKSVRGGQAFSAPSLPDLPPTQTLWTIQGPRQLGRGLPALAHLRADSLRQDRVRVETREHLRGFSPPALAQDASKESLAWRQSWEKYVEAGRRELVLAGGVPPGKPAGHERGQDSPPPTRDSTTDSSASPSLHPAELLRWRQDPWGPVTRCAVQGLSDRLVVHYSDPARGDLIERLLLSVMLCGVTALALFTRRLVAVLDWLVRWPYAAGVLLGLAWWLFLNPSVVGLLMMCVCAIAAVRPR